MRLSALETTRFCANPELSRASRIAFLEQQAQSGRLVIPAHFPAPSFGTIVRHADSCRFRYLG
jgi:hypothetical protein